MKTLAYPLHFYIPEGQEWKELSHSQKEIPLERLAQITISPLDCWAQRSYYELAAAGLQVSYGSALDPGAINVVEAYSFGRRLRIGNAFVVAIRGDGHVSPMADWIVHQNRTQAQEAGFSYLPLWPQPGIIPRNEGRGHRFETFSFKGSSVNLAEEFLSDGFLDKCRNIGIEGEGSVPEDPMQRGIFWANYSEIDAVLAVRRASRYDLRNKPASKLVNAWFGEVPAILGPEVGFRELRQSDLDYIEVRSPSEAIDAFASLKNDAGLRDAMVKNGIRRRQEFTAKAIVHKWVDLFNGEITQAFKKWRDRPSWYRFGGNILSVISERRAIARHKAKVFRSERVIDFES